MNYEVKIYSQREQIIVIYVVNDATSPENAARRACRRWMYSGCGEITEITVTPI